MVKASFDLQVELISTETIKPSSPTPHHLKNFDLSIYDQLFTPPIYTELVLFYAAGDTPLHRRHQQLKSSLSETLVRFYPFAGRIVKDELYVDCNDQGVDYTESKVNCRISDILDHPDPTVLHKFLPSTSAPPKSGSPRMVFVQVNAFECGGLAVGLRMSHKITDASTMGTFVKGWAATARGSGETVVPALNIASRFPAIPNADMPVMELPVQGKCVTRRYVFSGPKIAHLRSISRGKTVINPTRVESVTALIWQCLIQAKSGNLTKPAVVGPSVNLRRRIDPPLPEYSVGNFVGFFSAQFGENDDEIEIGDLVGKLRGGLEDICTNFVKEMVGEEGLVRICEMGGEYARLLMREDIDFYTLISWCRFGFYEADFRWGRPEWVSTVAVDVKNMVVMMDTSDGDGIEAWVTLQEQDMALFGESHQLLDFASLNPSALQGQT